MATELVDVEFRKNNNVIKSTTTRLDTEQPNDLDGLLADMERHLGVTDPQNYEIQIRRRATGTDLGTYQLGTHGSKK